MKHIKIQLRNMKACLLAAFALCFVSAGSARAQIYPQYPGTQDRLWYSSSSAIQGMNTAMISTTYLAPPVGYIYASAYYDASGTEVVYVKDENNGLNLTLQPSHTLYGTPDVCTGNYNPSSSGCGSCSAANTDFFVAVAYIGPSNTVYIDIFDVYDNTSSMSNPYLFLGISKPYTTLTPITGYVPHTVHIDAIAEYGNTGITGIPFCDKFVVAWDDYTTAGKPNVYAAYGSMNGGAITVTQQINPYLSNVYGATPDVAGVQRTIGGGTDDFALVTWLDKNGNELYYSEWDVTGSSPTFQVYDNGGTSSSISAPRIDAWDDYGNNVPTSSYSVYKIAAQIDSSFTFLGSPVSVNVIRTYDNVTYAAGGGSDFTCSDVENITNLLVYSAYSPVTNYPYNCYAPSVAFGPYTSVMHYTAYDPTSPNNNAVFLEPMEYNNSYQVLFGTNYYWVNSHLSAGPGYPLPTNAYSQYVTSVSTAANNIGAVQDLYAWAWYDGTDYNVSYKIPTTNFYAFRQSAAVGNTPVPGAWKVFPNPASNELTVQTTGAGAASGYEVTDMAGRELLHGGLQQGNTDIDVSMLPPGAYLVRLLHEGTDAGNAMFVKD